MKQRKRKLQSLMLVLTLAFILLVSLTQLDAEAATKKKPSLKTSSATIYCNYPSANRVKIVAKGNSYKIKSTIFSVSKKYKKLISVSKSGIVTGKKEGTAYVSCKMIYYKGKKKKDVTYKFKTVVKKAVFPKITVKNSSVQIGDSVSLSSVKDAESVSYKSSDSSVLSVNSQGLIKGIKKGSAVITITAKNKPVVLKKTVTINVKDPDVAVEAVRVRSSVQCKLGHARTLYAVVSPSNATNQKVTWSSDDPSIVKVNSKGQILALCTGKVYVRATTEDGHFSAACKVTVLAPSDEELSSYKGSGETYYLRESKTYEDYYEVGLQAYTQSAFSIEGGKMIKEGVNMKYTSTERVHFESSDEDVLWTTTGRSITCGKITSGISEYRGTAYAVKAGKAILTMRRDSDNAIVGKYLVTVTSDDPFYTWRQKILREHTTSDMTNAEKINRLAIWFGQQSRYPDSTKGIYATKGWWSEEGWKDIENGCYIYTCDFVPIMFYYCHDLHIFSYLTRMSGTSHQILHFETDGKVYHCTLQGGDGYAYGQDICADAPCSCYYDENGNKISSDYYYRGYDK